MLVQQDSCDYAGGSVLYQQQVDDNGTKRWVIVDLWSKVFPEAWIKWHISIKEGQYLCVTCQHWAPYLLPRVFLLNTDHRNLVNMYQNQKLDNYNELIQRQVYFLHEFHFVSTDIVGDLQPLCDQISRGKVEILLKLFKHNEKCIKDYNEKEKEILETEEKLFETTDVTREEMNEIIKKQYKQFKICMISNKKNRLNNINEIIFDEKEEIKGKTKEVTNQMYNNYKRLMLEPARRTMRI